jgi:hypothetical protein
MNKTFTLVFKKKDGSNFTTQRTIEAPDRFVAMFRANDLVKAMPNLRIHSITEGK